VTRLACLALALAWPVQANATPEAPPSAPQPAAEPAVEESVASELDAALAEGRLGAASMRCEQLRADGSLSLSVRERCGKILLGLGDRLRDAGSPLHARTRWDEAATYDPRLLDDPSYLARLRGDSVVAEPPRAEPEAPQPTPTPAEVRAPSHESGPRWDLGFGMGMSFGFDGLAAATLGWLTDESLLLEVSFGIVYPSADVRVRWLGLRHCLTPFLGFGLFVPFGEDDRMGLDLSGYDNLYELGESVHIDIGLAYMPLIGLDLYAGVSFLTPMDRDHPDTVLLFPQFTAGASWYF
jgi:hypothetical protein